MGRPSSYTPEVAARICELLASGSSLKSACETHDELPDISTVFVWLSKHKDFADNYVRAREAWADAEFERIMEIADTPVEGEKRKIDKDGNEEITTGDMIEHRKLQIDARKWALARMSPRKYGDRIAQEITNPDGSLTSKMTDAQIAARLVAIQQAAEKRKKDAADGDGSDLV